MRNALNRTKSTLIHDLKSFLQHSGPSDPTSTVYRGTLFEWQTHEVLEKTLGMRLRRVGGKSDGGIDLRGTWPLLHKLPSLVGLDKNYPHRENGIKNRSTPTITTANIIVQCKNTKAGCTPDQVRGLVGSAGIFDHLEGKNEGTIAILATSSSKRYTSDTISYFMDSNMPLALARICHIQLDSLLFNPAAESLLNGLSVTTQYDAHGHPTPILMYNGYIIDNNSNNENNNL
ncbi:hypothetical protein BDA99DRAFT_535012 [Phascolomyces articulosus]|uniref:Required for respiratory growth protein 7, mitochondrial n=1 Tax=Phascolomyces articulosus TaxID=60185 RepID=A0AAD5KEW9_9FUNG|nr:hypothetical protein BDA99DRAFT_535012 [Phascolomyces articulosus]